MFIILHTFKYNLYGTQTSLNYLKRLNSVETDFWLFIIKNTKKLS